MTVQPRVLVPVRVRPAVAPVERINNQPTLSTAEWARSRRLDVTS